MNTRIKVLFFIHNLEKGGAQRVLVNLVNNMDLKKFDVHVVSMLGGGYYAPFIKKDIHYRSVFPFTFRGSVALSKLLSPVQLHKLCVKEQYDVEISYLEGITSRVVSGCSSPCTKLISWVHVEQRTRGAASSDFRNIEEAEECYSKYDEHIYVADSVKKDFLSLFPQKKPGIVLYNTVDSDEIIKKAKESAEELLEDHMIRLVSVGTLKEVKGYERLLRIVHRLVLDKYPVHLYLLGEGPQKNVFEQYIDNNNLQNHITLLGYQENPYKYVAKCDLFVCSSYREGFSTAVTESLIVGTPVITTKVSGMEEMLGQSNEYGIIVDNDEEALYSGMKKLLDDPDSLSYYKRKATERGKDFSTQKTVNAVEEMLCELSCR